MLHKSELRSILDKEGIRVSDIVYDTQLMTALGIGDLLISFALLKQKLISSPIVINLSFFENGTYPNPTNALEFRIKLIKYILISNNLPLGCVIYAYGDRVNQHLDRLPQLSDWGLCLPKVPVHPFKPTRKYVIFHTKYRSVWKKHHEVLDKVRKLYRDLKIKNYDIVLLGERKMVNTPEQRDHTIATIYDDLLKLRNHNQIIDLTQETIYNSLDINTYIMDCNLIKGAKKNILVGFGGQLVTSLIFNQKSVVCLRFEDGIDFNQKLDKNIMCDYDKYETILRSL